MGLSPPKGLATLTYRTQTRASGTGPLPKAWGLRHRHCHTETFSGFCICVLYVKSNGALEHVLEAWCLASRCLPHPPSLPREGSLLLPTPWPPSPPYHSLLTPTLLSHSAPYRGLGVSTRSVSVGHACLEASLNLVLAVPGPCWEHHALLGGWPARVQDSMGTSLSPIPKAGT